MTWLVIITTTAAWQKITSPDIRIGFFSAANDLADKLASGTLPASKAAIAPQLIFNLHLDAYITLFFIGLLWLIIIDMLRICWFYLSDKPVLPLSETEYIQSRLLDDWVRD